MLNYIDAKIIENISYSDIFFGSFKFFNGLIKIFFIYKKTYENYLQIIFNIIKRKSEILCKLRNGISVTLTSFQLINLIANSFNHPEFQFDFEHDLVKFKMQDMISLQTHDIIIYGGISNGDVSGIFMTKEYDSIPIKNNVVLDIGANIADSSIYFSLMGAKKVIGIEPFSRNFYLAEKNIKENNLNDKIFVKQAICSDYSGTTEISLNDFSTASSTFERKNGLIIPSFTIAELILAYDLPLTSVLKVDCEGDEYKIFLNSSKDTLRTFSFILIEYHYGYENLKKYLEDCGFDVKVDSPIVTGQINWIVQFIRTFGHSMNKTKIGATGLLYAKRNSE
jgi:FkbM family methyltransferase